ncbi:peptidase family M41-domain-containing protein [Cercophora newfieldiana]|uniref:Peptidase family M41-domain-containing protein n=1 Tax=Cercophora newfieldiana TaxID=92897 RepID=A0AA39YIB2_9PEZI|nr:peptidase family M41-domain-containing protein [Cercophora newfieldiana]
MFRPANRQLAHSFARLSLSATVRPAYRSAAFARIAPVVGVSSSRSYSAKPPQRPKKNNNSGNNGGRWEPGQEKKDLGENQTPPESSESPARPLPDGWVRLTEEEVRHLEYFFKNTPPMKGSTKFDHVFEDLKKYGAPLEVREMIAKQKAGSLGMMDGIKAVRALSKFIDEIPNMTQNAQNNTFTSNKPGQQDNAFRDEGKEQGERQQQEQQQQSQEDQRQQQHRSQSTGNKENQKGGPEPPRFDVGEMAVGIGGLIIFYTFYSMFSGESSREITWQELRKNFLDKGLVEKMVVEEDRVRVYLNREATQSVYPDSVAARPGFHYYFSIGSKDAFERRLDEVQAELGIPSSDRIPVSYASPGVVQNLLFAFGPTLLLIGLLGFLSRRAGGMGGGGGGGMFGFGKSKAKMFNQDSAVKVKFADVAGMDEAKLEIMEFVSFLKSPERFQRLGAKIPRGAILSGPPGTGKTLLAKATAGESQVPFFTVSGSEFVEMFVGVGASRVRDLFSTARKNAPCIIFIDEIDAIGKSRAEGGGFRGGNDEREATLNQILTEMDGFNTSEQVVVLAGTNRPDILDQALMRPGRFDRHIHVDRPTMKGRQDIFKVHLKQIVTKEDIEHLTGRLAALTPGFAGADIANAVNEAALVAARANATSVEMIHFEQAIERVIGGLERKSLVLSPEEKRTVAYHEAGHAICGWFFRWADPLLKVSIIPRGQGALGYAQYLPSSDAYLMNTNQLMDRMAMTLGGRVSEELHFPTVTTGASDDFKKVTRMATTMVTQWGMSEKVGPLHFKSDENTLQKPFAESTAQTIDAEVRRIVDEAYKQCKDLLIARKKEVALVAEELLRKEMLTRDDLVRLLGPREWPDKEEFTKYFDGKQGTAPPPFPTESTDSPNEPQPAMFEKKADEPPVEDAKN